MRIFEVEVIAPCLHFIAGDLPCNFGFRPALALSTAPPVNAGTEVLDVNGFSHGVGFLPIRHVMLVEPNVLGWRALLKKQKVRADAGIRFEDTVGEPDDGWGVAFFPQVFLESRFDAFAEQ